MITINVIRSTLKILIVIFSLLLIIQTAIFVSVWDCGFNVAKWIDQNHPQYYNGFKHFYLILPMLSAGARMGLLLLSVALLFRKDMRWFGVAGLVVFLLSFYEAIATWNYYG